MTTKAMREIPLSSGFVAIIDDQDYPEISKFNWQADQRKSGRIYATRKEWPSGKKVYMHREILEVPEVDHRDNDGLNNRRYNLRPCTRRQNTINKPRVSSRNGKPFASQYRGVSFVRRTGRWRSSIRISGKKVSLGNFSTDIDAHNAWLAAVEVHADREWYMNAIEKDKQSRRHAGEWEEEKP